MFILNLPAARSNATAPPAPPAIAPMECLAPEYESEFASEFECGFGSRFGPGTASEFGSGSVAGPASVW